MKKSKISTYPLLPAFVLTTGFLQFIQLVLQQISPQWGCCLVDKGKNRGSGLNKKKNKQRRLTWSAWSQTSPHHHNDAALSMMSAFDLFAQSLSIVGQSGYHQLSGAETRRYSISQVIFKAKCANITLKKSGLN